MSTAFFNEEALDTSNLIPKSLSATFVSSKITQKKIYCKECFDALEQKIALQFRFDDDLPVFFHENCVTNPPAPKALEADGLIQVPVTKEGWTWDPPLNIGDRCIIVASYYHDWLFNKSEAASHSKRISSAYDSEAEWDSHSTLTLEKIKGEMAKVTSERGKTRIVPLNVLWTLEVNKNESLTDVLVS